MWPPTERLSQLTLAVKELADQVETLKLAIAVLTAAAQPPAAAPPMTVMAAVQAPLWDSVFEYGPAGTSPWAGAGRTLGFTKDVPEHHHQQQQWNGVIDHHHEQQQHWDGVGKDIPEEQERSEQRILSEHLEQQHQQQQQQVEKLSMEAAANVEAKSVGQAGQVLRVQNRTSIGLAAFRPSPSTNGKPAVIKRAWWQPFPVPVHEAPSASTTHAQAEVSSKTWTTDNSSEIVRPPSVDLPVKTSQQVREAQVSDWELLDQPTVAASDAVSHLESSFEHVLTPLDMQAFSRDVSNQPGQASAVSLTEQITSFEPVLEVTDTTNSAAMATSLASAPPSCATAPVGSPPQVTDNSGTTAQQLETPVSDKGGLVTPFVLSIGPDVLQPLVMDCTLRLQLTQPVVITVLQGDSATTAFAPVSQQIEQSLPEAVSTLEDHSAADIPQQAVPVSGAGSPPAAAYQSSSRRIDITCGITKNSPTRAFGVWLVDEYESREQQTGPGIGRLPACVEYTRLETRGVPEATEVHERITPMQFLTKAGNKSRNWKVGIHVLLPGGIVGPSIGSILSSLGATAL